ncbi:hypothetical protein ACTVH1_09650 [Gluconobacter cerinus]
MSGPSDYTPPKVWTWTVPSGGKFASTNRPTAGATHEQALPVGRHPLQLYSLGTPNGVKVTILLEELLAAGHTQAEYDAWLIRIGEGDQFGSGFKEINPNSKIPALVDHSADQPLAVFESGSMQPDAGRQYHRHMSDYARFLQLQRGKDYGKIILQLPICQRGRPDTRWRVRKTLWFWAPLCDSISHAKSGGMDYEATRLLLC